MNFNVGSAFKYVYRRGDKVEHGMTKEQAIQKDLDKALWYIRDEYTNCWAVSPTPYGAFGDGNDNLLQICLSESLEESKSVYKKFFDLEGINTSGKYIEALVALEVALLNLKEYERSAV